MCEKFFIIIKKIFHEILFFINEIRLSLLIV